MINGLATSPGMLVASRALRARRGDDVAGGAVDHHDHVRRGLRNAARALGVWARSRRAARPSASWPAARSRGRLVAVDLLRQCADRRRHRPAGGPAGARVARRDAPAPGSGGGRVGDGGADAARLRDRQGAVLGLGRQQHARARGGRDPPAGGVRADRAALCRAACASERFSQPRAHRCERRDHARSPRCTRCSSSCRSTRRRSSDTARSPPGWRSCRSALASSPGPAWRSS